VTSPSSWQMFVLLRPAVVLSSRFASVASFSGQAFSRRRPTLRSQSSGLESAWEYGEKTPWQDTESTQQLRTPSSSPLLFSETDLGQIRAATEALRAFTLADRFDQFRRVASSRTSRVAAGFERASNPNNVWACLRTIDAAGVQEVDFVLDDAHALTQRRAKRGEPPRAGVGAYGLRRTDMASAMGSQKWLTLAGHDSAEAMCASLRDRGFLVCATDLGPGAVPVSELFPPANDQDSAEQKYAVIFGNEEVGISPELRACADRRFYVPMRGFAESFNLSVAAAAVLSHLDARGYLAPDLDAAHQEALVLTWLLRSVKASRPILARRRLALPAAFRTHFLV